MNLQTRKLQLSGSAGALEVLVDEPNLAEGQELRGTALVCHPHPLFGGSMDNKVVQTLARAFMLSGWRAVRFNFRGVGASVGVYDEGRGECDDALAVIAQVAPHGALALAGFSFGAFIASEVVQRLPESRPPEQVVLVGVAASRFSVAPVPQALHDRTLVVHGEVDDTVPLDAVLQWARPQNLPVTVIPGVAHFFHGQLPLLRALVLRHLRAG